jgi:guanine nucleotide-binding protein subunit alpha
MPRRPPSPDPLVILPPPDETPQQRATRLQSEAEAAKISAAIDAELEVPLFIRLRHICLLIYSLSA